MCHKGRYHLIELLQFVVVAERRHLFFYFQLMGVLLHDSVDVIEHTELGTLVNELCEVVHLQLFDPEIPLVYILPSISLSLFLNLHP